MGKKTKKSKKSDSLNKGNTDRFRLWFILLYLDTDSYDFEEVLFNLKGYKNWAYIQHKKESQEKKDHVHFLLKLDNGCTKSAISKKTGIPSKFIKVGIHERSLARYLIHLDDPDKIQYEINNVKCSRSYERHFKKHLEDKETEDEIISKIYEQLNKLAETFSSGKEIYPVFIQWLNANCYDTIYKRYRYEFRDYLTMIL